MAKCFQVVGQGVAVRMSDDDAHEVVVRDGDGQYCPKHVWREGRASAYRVEQDDNCLRKLRAGPKGKRIISPVETLARHDQHKKGRAA